MKIATAQLWVHDQEEALAFYTQKLGMEVRSDVTVPEMGNFRWLTVGPVGQPDISIVLMAVPGPPMMDEATRTQVLDLMGKGFAGTVFLTTDDVPGQLRGTGGPRGASSWTRPRRCCTASTGLPRPVGQHVPPHPTRPQVRRLTASVRRCVNGSIPADRRVIDGGHTGVLRSRSCPRCRRSATKPRAS